MSEVGKAFLASGDNLPLAPRTTRVSGLWATTFVLALVFASALGASAADASPSLPQIQGEQLRIQFDRYLRSRVIARFGDKEITTGPFVASEKVEIADKVLTVFSLVSKKSDRVSDAFGAGEQLKVVGKAGPLSKEVIVTIYDEFPAMAFFDVRSKGRTFR